MAGHFRKRYLLGEFQLEPDAQRLKRNGLPVHLPKKPFQVLLYLVENRDRVVPRAELLDHFWDGKQVYDDALRKAVGKIRKALGDSPEHPRFIETRCAVGFRYIGPLVEQLHESEPSVVEVERTRGDKLAVEQEVQELEASETRPEGATADVADAAPHSRVSGRWAALVLVLIVVIGGPVFYILRRRPAALPPPSAPARSVAVLPLENLSDDPGKVKLTPRERSHLAKPRQTNPEAFDSYLHGKFHFNLYTEKDSERAIENLEQAVATDPGFAEARAALALAYQYKFVGFKPEEKQLQKKIFVEVEKAIALDPALADAYIVRGRTLWSHANHFRHEEALREYRRALSLNPNSDEAFFQTGLIYNHIGLFDKAHQEFQKAIAINPNNVRARWFTGQTILYQGKYQEFLAISRNLPRKMNPHLAGYQIALALFHLGRKDEALTTLDEFLRDFPEDTPGTLASMQAVIFAATGQRSKAEKRIKIAAKKERDSVQFHHTAYNIGTAYALMNKPKQAMKWLQSAAEDGFPCYPIFETDPSLNNIRQDPRFVEFIAKLKEQWESYQTTL